MITPDSRSVVDLPALPRDLSLRIMDLNKLRRYLLARGIVRIYTLFMAGYFLLPMATGHRRLYFILVLPARGTNLSGNDPIRHDLHCHGL